MQQDFRRNISLTHFRNKFERHIWLNEEMKNTPTTRFSTTKKNRIQCLFCSASKKIKFFPVQFQACFALGEFLGFYLKGR